MAMHAPHRAALAALAATLTILTFGPAMAISDPSLLGRAARFSVWYPENDYTQVVIPPAFPDDAVAADEGTIVPPVVPSNVYSPLGSVRVDMPGWEQELALNRITVAPGEKLWLADRADAGLIVLESGWLELTERRGPARVSRGPALPLLAPQLVLDTVTLDAGDRLSFEPEATMVLANRGDRPASILMASVATVEAGIADDDRLRIAGRLGGV